MRKCLVEKSKAKALAEKLRCASTPGATQSAETCWNCYFCCKEAVKGYDIPPDITVDGVGYWLTCNPDLLMAETARYLEGIVSEFELCEGGGRK